MPKRKNIGEHFDFNVSTWVSLSVKQKLYEIAEQENSTIAEVVRNIIVKGLENYKEVNGNG